MLHTRQHTHTRLSGFNRNWVSHPVESRRSRRPPPSPNGRTSTKLIKSNMIFLFAHMPLVSPFCLFIACQFSRSSSMSLRALSSVLCLRSPALTARTQEIKLRRKHTIEMEKRSLLVCLHMFVVYCPELVIEYDANTFIWWMVRVGRWPRFPFPII